MKKRLFLAGSLVLLLASLVLIPQSKKDYNISSRSTEAKSVIPVPYEYKEEGSEIERNSNPKARAEFEFNQLKDPKTGKIPALIRVKELEFARQNLVRETVSGIARSQRAGSNQSNATQKATFENFGPVNIGGRTRGIAIDAADENILLAGGVSGGVWRSTDQGASWTRSSSLTQHPAVTDIVQDTRTGKTNVWYYATGESQGSADFNADSYYGNG
ncbi:MAG: hypothetical protein ACI82Q_002009, partial [Nonlabens sp.]